LEGRSRRAHGAPRGLLPEVGRKGYFVAPVGHWTAGASSDVSGPIADRQKEGAGM
jgi:hypothetical protein